MENSLAHAAGYFDDGRRTHQPDLAIPLASRRRLVVRVFRDRCLCLVALVSAAHVHNFDRF